MAVAQEDVFPTCLVINAFIITSQEVYAKTLVDSDYTGHDTDDSYPSELHI